MIFVGIDDTDTVDSRGTNQLAKALARSAQRQLPVVCHRIVRHQLWDDPRVPCTSKNGSASLVFDAPGAAERGGLPSLAGQLWPLLREEMLAEHVEGSDPGLCVAIQPPPEIVSYGLRCQREWVEMDEALELAAGCGVRLEGLGGTCQGVVGALAAVALAAGDNDGRVVQWQRWPDDLRGRQPLATLRQREIDVRVCASTSDDEREALGPLVECGIVDVGKKLRPNWRQGRCVLFVVSAEQSQLKGPEVLVEDEEMRCWSALKLP